MTDEGRTKNRRTRIILMPKLDQFYDLLNPDKKSDKPKWKIMSIDCNDSSGNVVIIKTTP
jgi:hypothetical protein